MRLLAGLATGLLILGVGGANAKPVGVGVTNTITVDYQITNPGLKDVSGSFTGVDSDDNGWLILTELTDWSIDYVSGANFAALNDIGDFDYYNNIWTPNAFQWDQTKQDAYMTWNAWSLSFSTSNWDWVVSTTTTTTNSQSNNPVPEPATMLLFGTGLVGLVGARLRKKKK